MEVLNAAGLTPFSPHKIITSERKTQPRRSLSPFKPSKPATFVQLLSQGFTALSTAFLHGSANALTYEEALGQATETFAPSDGGADVDIGGFLDGIAGFVSENPLVIGGGALVLAVPLVLAQVLRKPRAWGVESAKNAFAKLGEEGGAQLLDIRGGRDFTKVGSPDIRSLKKKAVSIVYKKEDKQGFLKKLALKFKDPASTTLYILDKFDGNSELVAELVTANGFKAAFAIKDGAEGARGWMKSGLPWTPPKKTPSLDFDGLKDAITSVFGGGSDGLPVTLGLAAATGLGVVAFSEIETILQLLGSAAIIQFVTKKLLFAEDRKVTLQQLDEFLVTKIAPNELADEIKLIGKALLPTSSTKTASLPAPAEVTPITSASPTEVQQVDATPTSTTEVKVESTTDQPAIVNSVSTEVIEESLPVPQRPLSPYAAYPDLKPPTSPTPSTPTTEVKLESTTDQPAIINSVSTPEVIEESLPHRPLSPYAAYPDFKPPTSPTPSTP